MWSANKRIVRASVVDIIVKNTRLINKARQHTTQYAGCGMVWRHVLSDWSAQCGTLRHLQGLLFAATITDVFVSTAALTVLRREIKLM
jgi:hypothetical protein